MVGDSRQNSSLICCLNCKFYVRMDLILQILFSKQVPNFLSCSNFVTKSIESHTANFMLHQILWFGNFVLNTNFDM